MSSHFSTALEHWELLTLKGDELFYIGSYQKAAKQFYQSVGFVESYLALPNRNLPALLRSFVIGCHNIAACYLRLANSKEAEYYYHYAMRHLQQLSDEASPACRYQSARLIELDYARSKYMNYLMHCIKGRKLNSTFLSNPGVIRNKSSRYSLDIHYLRAI